MSRWLQEPELDESARVGLGFIAIGYGVVLVAVFPMQVLAHMGVAALFHLALAASVLVISWMGYYDNRVRFPEWRVQFFNIPLWQYLLSFGILFGYWELGITVEKTGGHPATPTPRSEAFILFIVFLAYLVWGVLEIIVQESKKYTSVLNWKAPDKLPPKRLQCGTKMHKPPKAISEKCAPGGYVAMQVRGQAFVTLVFVCIYGLLLAIVIFCHLRGTAAVVAVDSFYIVTLFAYRYLQWIVPNWWYVRLLILDTPEANGFCG
jgi:hypothetical protein